MVTRKKRRRKKHKTPSSLFKCTMPELSNALFGKYRMPVQENKTEEKPMPPADSKTPTVWPATKNQTPEAPTTSAPLPETSGLGGPALSVVYTAAQPSGKKLTPAELLAAKKRQVTKSTDRRLFFTSLKEMRIALNLTCEDVGDAVGLAGKSYSAIENGRSLSLIAAFRIAEFYGKSIHEIWSVDHEATSGPITEE